VHSSFVAGLRPTRRHRNGNPEGRDRKMLDIWNWDQDRLATWLAEELQRSTSLVCCEVGFSNAVLKIQQPRILKLATIRDPKSRLISNFMFAVRRGHTAERDILSYVKRGGNNARPDYYTNLIIGRTGEQARAEAEAAIKALDYVQILGAPNSWDFLSDNLLINGDTKLQKFHRNATDYKDDALKEPWQSVLDADSELDAICAEEAKLFAAVRAHFAPSGFQTKAISAGTAAGD